MALHLIHTASQHEITFDTLRDRIAPGARIVHHSYPDWLTEARENGVGPDLTARLAQVIRAADGPVICTCTTLGPASEPLGAMRIDRPMMRAAADLGGVAVMAYALDSTKGPSAELFQQIAGPDASPRMLDLTRHWPLFEAGNALGFHRALAQDIRADFAAHGGDCVILAQASMAGAAVMLNDLDVPVLASPELALRSGLDQIAG